MNKIVIAVFLTIPSTFFSQGVLKKSGCNSLVYLSEEIKNYSNKVIRLEYQIDSETWRSFKIKDLSGKDVTFNSLPNQTYRVLLIDKSKDLINSSNHDENTTNEIIIDCEQKDALLNATNKEIIIGLYPNPSEGEITVYSEDNEFINSEFEIINAIGQRIMDGKIENLTNTISLEDLNSGVYLINITKKGVKIASTNFSLTK